MKNFYACLPAYLGGKRRLCRLIFALLSSRVPRSRWADLTFLDPFLGGGSVSLSAKVYGFNVICNDLALRSAAIGRAFIANSMVTLAPIDVATVLGQPPGEYPRVARERYSPSVFSEDHADFLDRALWWACSDLFAEPKRSLLLTLIVKWLLRIQPMSQLRGTDARAAFGGDYDKVSPRRLDHYLRSRELLQPSVLWRLAREVNRGVFPGRGTAHQEDVLALLPRLPGDIVYLDPPYPGTSAYEREYAVIDDFLEGKTRATSPFSTSTATLTSLFESCRHIPYWLVSLNNAALDLEALSDLIRPHRPKIRAVEVPYRHLGSIATERKNAENKEFIVLATN